MMLEEKRVSLRSEYSSRAYALLYRHQYEDAIRAFDETIQLDDKFGPAYIGKGEALLELNHHIEAEIAFNKALQYLPDNERAHDGKKRVFLSKGNVLLDRGKDLLSLKHFDEANRAFDGALQCLPGNTQAYLGKGRAFAGLKQYKEAIPLFEKAISLQPENPIAFTGKGDALRNLKDYKEALENYDKAIQLHSQSAPAHVGKGHTLYALNRPDEALQAYKNAIQHYTDDVYCYSNSGEILAHLGNYEKAEEMYNQALQFAPDLISARFGQGNVLYALQRYQEALTAYQQLVMLDHDNIMAYVGIGNIQMVLQAEEEATEAYDKALELIEYASPYDFLWSLVNFADVYPRPAEIQFALLRPFILNAQQNMCTTEALNMLGNLHNQLFDPQSISAEKLQVNVKKLAQMLERLRVEDRFEVLVRITNNDIDTVHMLILLESYHLTGLDELAYQLTLRLKPEPRDDDLFEDFYLVLDSYRVPKDDADWLYAQALVAEQNYREAQSLLSELVKQRPEPDILWLLAEALNTLDAAPQDQLQTLIQFTNKASSSDKRMGQVWERIGQFYEGQRNYQAALQAYEQADIVYKKTGQNGCVAPLLHTYRTGNWKDISGLDTHDDFAFPLVIVIDLESDYKLNAALGSTVFEIGAVCMKGSTELATYEAVIQREIISSKVKDRQHAAKPREQVVVELRAFIEQSQQSLEKAIIVGHNFQAFDAPHLRALGLPIDDNQIIDTLTFARLLHPDSIHHNLSLLCEHYEIPLQKAHNALPDARACAQLLYALGEELVARGKHFLAGFRAFVPVGSAFDRVVLQPRKCAASPNCVWELNPEPTPIQILPLLKNTRPSPQLMRSIRTGSDALIERFDSHGAYASELPRDRRTVVAVATRGRLEQLLAAARGRTDLFVLPDPHTLLCPHRLHERIESEESPQVKLALFCLYQAAHNHDAGTLYPLRLYLKREKTPESSEEMQNGDAFIQKLRQILLEMCCANNSEHVTDCSAQQNARKASEENALLLTTHENFLRQPGQLSGDLLIVDDIDDLQMHFAEYLANGVKAQELEVRSRSIYDLLNASLSAFVARQPGGAALHKRLTLSRIVPYLTQPQNEQEKSLLDLLREEGREGENIAQTLAYFCWACSQQPKPGYVQAYWLDLVFRAEQTDASKKLEDWRFHGINEDLHQAFSTFFWQPFHQHIFCGTAITLGASETHFLRRALGIPQTVPFLADEKEPVQAYIPDRETIRPSSFLAQRSWAESAGAFLYRLALASQHSIVVTFHTSTILEALARAFDASWQNLNRRTLSSHLDWTITRINDYLCEKSDQRPIVFLSPYQRRATLNNQVGIEVTGPLRFLNQQDPLVAAQMHAFVTQEGVPKDRPFTAYFLPQALLELKARTSSGAAMYIILDSALNHAMYRDEVSSLFDHKMLNTLPDVPENELVLSAFEETLSNELTLRGFSTYSKVEDEDLYETLHTYWGEEKNFRVPPTDPLDQKAIIQNVFVQKDQLVIAATGGGKSLCFQLPAILLAQDIVPKVTLVISPLIALMQDQVESLRRRSVFSAILWNSTLIQIDRGSYLRGIKQGDYSIIYIAPEQVYSAALRDALRGREIGLIAIDEAHCVSQWGHNFRTAYFQLNDWIDTQICQGLQRTFPLLALTATARKGYEAAQEKSTIKDIIEKLGLHLREEDIMPASPERPELKFRVKRIIMKCPYCGNDSQEIGEVRCKNKGCQKRFRIDEEDIRQSKIQKLMELLMSHTEDSLRSRWDQPSLQMRQRGIIYCRTRKSAENVYEGLRRELPSLHIAYYHAGIQSGREIISRRFISDDDDRLDIVVATNAFGMGIDARLLGFVIHFDIPATLEAYYQEAGRAGRDDVFNAENRAQCILFYHANDLEGQRWLTSQNRITDQDIETVYKILTQIRGSMRSEILITESLVQSQSGLDTKKIDTILYYLERHTSANGKPVLKRRENGTQLWQIKFEQGYQERIKDPHMNPLSQQLAHIFCNSQQFLLNEEHTVIMDIDELATALDWERDIVEKEKKNLVRRRIIADADETCIRWNKSKAECIMFIEQLMKGIVVLLNNAHNQSALRAGEHVDISIQDLYDNGKLNAADVPSNIFIAFLDVLCKNTAGDLQLFATFISRTPLGKSRLRLQTSPDDTPIARAKKILRRLQQQLSQIVENFGYESIRSDKKQQSNNTRYINLLDAAPDYLERQQLGQALQWLQVANLLAFPKGEQRETVMRVIFLQNTVPADVLKIDLTTLRLVERYGERKLELMHEYAISSEEERKKLLHDYFFGHKPLIKPFAPHPDLTKEQRKLVMVSDGYHLIQAPAGSGKSFVLQEHFRYLVEHLLVPNERILVTAQQHGAINRLGNQLDYLQDASRPIPTKTLQSLAEGIFRNERDRLIGVDKQPYFPVGKEICLQGRNQRDRERLELEIVPAALDRLHSHRQIISKYLPAGMELPQLPKRYQPDYEKEKQYLNAISLFRSLGIFPAHIATKDKIEALLQHMIRNNTWLRNNLALCYSIYISYQLQQRELGSYTFDDQILFALAILRANPEIAEQWQRKYEHIIIDEFQDLKPAGAELIGLLSQKHQNVLAVGDYTQRINMDFSNEVKLDKTFARIAKNTYVNLHTLTTNFRSVQEILDFAQAIPDLPQIYGQKQMSARRSNGIKPKLVCMRRKGALVPEDRSGINKTILQAMVDAALHYKDQLPPEDAGSVALLAAKTSLSSNIQEYLQQKKHPFAVLEYRHHYQSEPAKRYLTYLRLIQNRYQPDMVEFLLKCCLNPHFTANQIARLKASAERYGQTLLETALDPDVYEEIKAEAELLPTLQKHIQVIQHYTSDSFCENIWPSIKALLQAPNHQQAEELDQAETSTSEDEELEEMLKELAGKTVQQALEHIDHFITSIEENRSNRRLIVATIDTAKSQDFDTVFLIGAEQLQEGRRWYVGVTRARQRFFALIEASSSISTHKILSKVDEQYYDVLYFPDDLRRC